jgi:hypothetical protein
MENITVEEKISAHRRLLAFINALSEPERENFAARCGTTVGYLRKAISIKQDLGSDLSLLIETHTQDLVSIKELNPDLADVLERAGYVRANPAMRAYLAKGREQA